MLCLAGLTSACAAGPTGPEPTATNTTLSSATASDSAGEQTIAPVDPKTLSHVSGVDGDTIKLSDGTSVRVIGIDTAERGQRCYAEASARTAELIAPGVVLQLAEDHEQADRYGRLLRYVTLADGSDLGTILLQEGLANARYDSIDGYDHHPKEETYRRISATTEHLCPELDTGNDSAAASASPARSGAAGCDPNYGGGCVPRSDTDLDCSDIDFEVTVKGEDPHHFDGDGDGIGCESNG